MFSVWSSGLRLTGCLQNLYPLSIDIETAEFVQVLNVADSHWILISTINCLPGFVKVYDSGG